MVAGFAILCLQHGVIGWSFALVIPDDGVQPGEETHRWIERHDRWEADAFAGFPLCRRAYAHGSDVENARLTGRQDSSHSRSRECVRQAAGFPCTHKSGPVNGAMSAPGGTTRNFAAAQNLVDAFGCVGNYCSLLTSTGAVGCGEIPPVKQQRGAGI